MFKGESLEEFKMIIQSFDPLRDGGIIFAISCGYDNTDIPKYLMEEYGIDMFINNYDKCLEHFPKSSDGEIINLLLDNGFGIRDTLVKKCLPNLQKIKILFNRDVDINLVLSICSCYPDVLMSPESMEFVVEQIITTYANHIYEEKILSKILTIYFVISDSPKINWMKKLLNMGADVHVHYAMDYIFSHLCEKKWREDEIIDFYEYLVWQCGCDINTGNSYCLQIAIWKNKSSVVRFLLDLGIKITDACISAALAQDKKYITILMQYGISAEKISEIYVSIMPNIRNCKFLVERGVDFNKIIRDHDF